MSKIPFDFWDGKNSNGRQAGSGSYIATVVINPEFRNLPKGSVHLKGVVEVKN